MSRNFIILNCYNGSYIPTHPQYQYLIDGLPAKTCGEWPGIKPNHWKGSLRVIHLIRRKKYSIETNTSLSYHGDISAKEEEQSSQ